MTDLLFRDDAYLKSAEAKVLFISDSGGIAFDKSVFYPNSGGQAGDNWFDFVGRGGNSCQIENTVKTSDGHVMLIPADTSELPSVNTICTQALNWEKRYRHMRLHTALHLLSVVIPLPVTGGQITSEKGRLDFDMPDAPEDKQVIEDQLNNLIAGDYCVTTSWISDDELLRNPSLVKTMSVRPPMGTGKVRLIKIGNDNKIVELHPCGEHSMSTKRPKIGPIIIGKVEKKGPTKSACVDNA